MKRWALSVWLIALDSPQSFRGEDSIQAFLEMRRHLCVPRRVPAFIVRLRILGPGRHLIASSAASSWSGTPEKNLIRLENKTSCPLQGVLIPSVYVRQGEEDQC